MFLAIYELAPARFLTAPEIAWQAALKKTESKLELLLLMVEKGIRGRICQAIRWCVKSNKKYMKDYDKNKEPSYLNYWYVKNFYRRGKSQKLSLDLVINSFKWVKNKSIFKENFIKNYNTDSDILYFLEIDVK